MKKRPTVKICGFMKPETVRAAARLPIDQAGFVFASSRRRVDARQASDMLALWSELNPERPQAAGVFVNEPYGRLAEIVRSVPLDIVQLHGSESPEYCRRLKEELGVAVYKVFSLRSKTASEGEGRSASDDADQGVQQADAEAQIRPFAPWLDACMLDTQGGGSGKSFDWRQIPAYQSAAAALGLPLIVAGGLTPDNVRELIREYRPDGVDVSSGVETDGEKDNDKIASFVERVKSS